MVNRYWALSVTENLILVAINGWIIMIEILWKIMEIAALCVNFYG